MHPHTHTQVPPPPKNTQIKARIQFPHSIQQIIRTSTPSFCALFALCDCVYFYKLEDSIFFIFVVIFLFLSSLNITTISSLTQSVMSEVVHMLQGLLSHEDSVRTKAESIYNNGKSHNPEQVVLALASNLNSEVNPVEATRALAAVLLRRIVSPSEKVWLDFQEKTREQIKHVLVRAFQSEGVSSVRRKVCHAMAQVAQYGNWKDLIPQVFKYGQSASTPDQLESVFFLLNKLIRWNFAPKIPPVGHFCPMPMHIYAGVSADMKKM